MKTIRISCSGADVIDLEKLSPFQGELKSLSQINYEKLKKQILTQGFTAPIHVWKQGDKNWCIDGHQRIRVLTNMKEEGYDIPLLPIDHITAKNMKDAKKILLAHASQYGQMESQGLYEFINQAEIGIDELIDFRFPEVNLDAFKNEFLDIQNEIETKEMTEPKKCPHCGEII